MLKTHGDFHLFVDAESYADVDGVVPLRDGTVCEDLR